MAKILDLLKTKLSAKRLTPVEATRVIKDVINILDHPEKLNTESVNNRLADMGWHEQPVDRAIMDLIIWFREEGKELCRR